MRRLLMVVMLGGILLGISSQAAAVAKWTVMIYMAADNNLDGAAIDDINEMEMVGSTSDMNVVVLLDRNKSNGNWTSTRRYYITQDADSDSITSTFVDLGEKNMGDPNTLSEFVAWAMTNYPASHYFLILWDHGSGWHRQPPDGLTEAASAGPIPSAAAGQFLSSQSGSVDQNAFPPPPFGGMGFKYVGEDETSGDALFNYEVRNALSSFPKLDIIGFDACVMGMVEVAYELRDRGSFMIASEESEPGDGWTYDQFLGYLALQPSFSPAQVCSLVVLTYSAYWGTASWPADPDGQTLSAVDLEDIRTVVTQTDNMVNAVIGGSSWPQIMAALPQAERFGGSLPYYDLYDISDLLTVHVTDPTIVSAASSLKGVLSDAIIINRTEAGHPYAHGLSIFFPQEYVNDYLLYCISPVDFADSIAWPTFLSYYFNDGSYILDYPEPNDLFTQAGLPLNPELSYPSYVSSLTDIDWWLINSGLSETITITLNSPANADLDMELYASDGATLLDSAVNRGTGVPDTIVYPTPGAGYYYLAVRGHNSFSTSPYQLRLSESGYNSGWFRLSYDDDAPDGGYFSYTDGDVIGASFSLPQYPMVLDRVWINFSGIAGGGSGNGTFYLLLYDNYGYVVDPLTIGPLVPPNTGWAYLDLTGIERLVYTNLFVGVWYDGVNTPVVAYDDHPSGRDYYWNAYTQSWNSLNKSLFIRLDVRYPTPTGVLAESDDGDVPKCFAVGQNYPNPFNASTVIEFNLDQPRPVTLDVYNILGQRIATPVDEPLTAGVHRIDWNGKDQSGRQVASGVYFYRLVAGDQVSTKRMVFLK